LKIFINQQKKRKLSENLLHKHKQKLLQVYNIYECNLFEKIGINQSMNRE